MKVAFSIWTAVVIIGVILISANAVRDEVYAGTDLSFEVDSERTLSIDASSEITLWAASSDFFLLRKLSGETVVGTPTKPPLGWDSKTYYVAGPAQIQDGQWIVEDGNITLHLISDNKITVTAVMSVGNKFGYFFLIFVVGVFVWLLGYIIGMTFSIDL
jgi:hypothetical protein